MLGIQGLTNLLDTDILIIGDQSNLNVYKTASEDNSAVGCCGPSEQGKSSCQNGGDAVRLEGSLKDVDLNEWAGECF